MNYKLILYLWNAFYPYILFLISYSYSSSGASVCTACPAGSYCVNGAMTSCTAGTYTSSTGASSCVTCPAGSFCVTGASSAPVCSSGS